MTSRDGGRCAGRRRWFAAASSAVLAFFLTGCLATTQEMEDLRVDIARLQESLSRAEKRQAEYLTSFQGTQADVLSQTNALGSRLEALSSRLEENDARMATLGIRLDDLDKNLSSRMDLLTEGVGGAKKAAAVAPSKLFQLAYDDFMKRRYTQALKGFEDYLEIYPDAAQASDVRFYIGECRFARKEWKEALAAYDAVITRHPNSDIAPSALLQRGTILEKVGETGEALKTYETLVKKYANKPESEAAQARIDSLRTPAPEPVGVDATPSSSTVPAAAPVKAPSPAPKGKAAKPKKSRKPKPEKPSSGRKPIN